MENNPITIHRTTFRYFFLKQYPFIKFKHEMIDSLKSEFEQYLTQKDLKPEALALIMPRPIVEILMYDKPTYIHGFHPAFVLHFHEFIKENLKEETKPTQ